MLAERLVRHGVTAIGAVLLLALPVGGLSSSGHAQSSNDLSTYSVAHQVSFQYPSTWDTLLDSTHITAVPAEPYSDGDAVGIRAPDGLAELDLRIYSGTSSALQDLQALLEADMADATGHPNFRLIAPAGTANVAGADNAAAAEYGFMRSDGSVGHYFQLFAARGDVRYQLQTSARDTDLGQYQSRLSQIAQSFQLLP
jgi:hypothetical protein